MDTQVDEIYHFDEVKVPIEDENVIAIVSEEEFMAIANTMMGAEYSLPEFTSRLVELGKTARPIENR